MGGNQAIAYGLDTGWRGSINKQGAERWSSSLLQVPFGLRAFFI
ncbi:hypothetical protein GGR92_001019 [Spirosoma lacussanchae]